MTNQNNIRLISRIDIKNEYVIKGINLEGLRKIGDPIEIAKKYYNDGIDEILFMDAVASLYERNNLFHIIENAVRHIFVPITIGGGIRKIKDIEKALRSGADKIAINTQAIKTPKFITDASRLYGSQSIIGSIEAKRKADSWEAYIENGRQETGVDAIEWAKRLQDLGAGELLITSVDQEGTRKGFDIKLLKKISESVSVPVVMSGGAGNINDIISTCNQPEVSGIALASILHYQNFHIRDIKDKMLSNNFNIRR